MDFQLLERIAEFASESRLYRTPIPKALGGGFEEMSKAMALMIILRGKDLGLSPATSLEQVRIYKGKLTLPAGTIAGCIQRSGKYSFRSLKHDDFECVLEFTFPGGLDVSQFSVEDARKAGIWSDMWSKYPRNMLFARALTNGARWFCAEVFGGSVYTPDELKDEPKKPFLIHTAPQGDTEGDTRAELGAGQNYPIVEPIGPEEWATIEALSPTELQDWTTANKHRLCSEEKEKIKILYLGAKARAKKLTQEEEGDEKHGQLPAQAEKALMELDEPGVRGADSDNRGI